MATRLVHPPIPAPHLLKQPPKIKTTQITLSAPAPRCSYSAGLNHCPFLSRTKQTLTRAASEEQRSGLLEDPKDSIALTKSSIYQALEGINRGVFGVTSAKRREIEDLVMQLESQNPTPNPILNLEKIIDVTEGKAVNVIKFSARGLSLLNGQLTIQASFSVASSSRVNIKYDKSQITPDQLMNLFKKNYELLLSIFNPEGWLDITYVDETMRIGRDDKGNIFILERSTHNDQL